MPFQIVRNDLTKMEVDAIVNTANPKPVFGTGLDKAVYEAAGTYNLLLKRQEIGEVAPGNSFITDGYELPAKYIIHTVGTKWIDGQNGEEEILRQCYRSVFKVAEENDIETLAIPLLASGNYRFPKKIAFTVAVEEIEKYMLESDVYLYLVIFDEESFSISREVYTDIDSFINNNYVEEKEKEEYPEGHDLRVKSADSYNKAVSSEEIISKKTGTGKFGETSKVNQKLEPRKRSLEDVIGDLDKNFMEMVFTFADTKGFSDAEVQRKANIDRRAFSKLKCGTTKKPSKETALALAIGLELNLDEATDLLARAGYAFSPSIKQDVIVRYHILNKDYNILAINWDLEDHGETGLGTKIRED